MSAGSNPTCVEIVFSSCSQIPHYQVQNTRLLSVAAYIAEALHKNVTALLRKVRGSAEGMGLGRTAAYIGCPTLSGFSNIRKASTSAVQIIIRTGH
jgi:hypothetical protein